MEELYVPPHFGSVMGRLPDAIHARAALRQPTSNVCDILTHFSAQFSLLRHYNGQIHYRVPLRLVVPRR